MLVIVKFDMFGCYVSFHDCDISDGAVEVIAGQKSMSWCLNAAIGAG